MHLFAKLLLLLLESAQQPWCWWTCRWARVSGGTPSTPPPPSTRTPPLPRPPSPRPPTPSPTFSAMGTKVKTIDNKLLIFFHITRNNFFSPSFVNPDPVRSGTFPWSGLICFRSKKNLKKDTNIFTIPVFSYCPNLRCHLRTVAFCVDRILYCKKYYIAIKTYTCN